MTKKISFAIFAFLCIGVGLYPMRYLLMEGNDGVLDSKSVELLANNLWWVGFYTHIIFGGIALLTGWSQFSARLRRTRLQWHRNLGKVYVISVALSGIAAIYIGFYATGGLITAMGFISLGIIWLSTTFMAFKAVREKRIQDHQKWMILSYAACFAAVTLRIWLPILISIFGEFLMAYKVVAWLCWVPNMLVALLIVRRMQLA